MREGEWVWLVKMSQIDKGWDLTGESVQDWQGVWLVKVSQIDKVWGMTGESIPDW